VICTLLNKTKNKTSFPAMKIKSLIRKKAFWMLVLPCISLFLMIDRSPLIPEKAPITGELAKTARDNAKALADALAAQRSFIDLSFDEEDVVAISAATSHLFDNINVALGYSPSFVQLAATTKIDLSLFSLYVNTSCEIELENTQSQLQACRLGDLYLPGFVVKPILNAGVWLIFDAEVSATLNSMIAGLRFEDRKLLLSASKSVDLRQRVSRSLSNASDLAEVAMSNDIPAPEITQVYLSELYKNDFTGQSLSLPVSQLAQLAAVRTLESDVHEENNAMIWALAIRFGGSHFAHLAEISEPQTQLGVTLNGREDLALHFLYSAILELVGNEALSFNIGELKEVLDSGKGGSGFSFVDLAADESGIAFSKQLTGSENDAIRSQTLLANAKSERVFFPLTHDLPEGFSESAFARVFTSVNSDKYKIMEQNIDARISSLPIHSNNKQAQIQIAKGPELPNVTPVTRGEWLQIDTHTHSKHSDGMFSIDEIAKQAATYGCDAIAITDHGDSNLSSVLSKTYFDDVARVNGKYNNMTVLAGFEWNIPPFGGKEHATVLFGQSAGDLQKLAEFRQEHDHYRERSFRHLNTKSALKWLQTYSQRATTQPVLIYNHPSRKVKSLDENLSDLSEWMQVSDLFIGVSGAPGHQAKRGKNNGSYEEVMRTVNGWDRVTSDIGGVWDTMLQNGYRVLGARADSDFHNTKMDYWPCQFSSTHIYSRSTQAADILHALRAGNTWAQHGHFVNTLDFYLSSEGRQVRPGDNLQATENGSATLTVRVRLNREDWQGFPTSLDELNLIVVQDNRVLPIALLPNAQISGNTIEVQMPMQITPALKAIRLQGRSIQSGLHDYQFMSNPIFFTEN
jgi:hypothetical protein